MVPESTTADFLPTRATIWILYFLERRNLEKKTRARSNNSMEEYRNQAINLHANQTQNSSKFACKTTQKEPLRFIGGPWGGPYPLRSLLPAVFSPY